MSKFQTRPLKPSDNRQRCEAALGIDYSGSAPWIRKCGQPGVWLYVAPSGPAAKFGMCLCDDCYQVIKRAAENYRQAPEVGQEEID